MAGAVLLPEATEYTHAPPHICSALGCFLLPAYLLMACRSASSPSRIEAVKSSTPEHTTATPATQTRAQRALPAAIHTSLYNCQLQERGPGCPFCQRTSNNTQHTQSTHAPTLIEHGPLSQRLSIPAAPVGVHDRRVQHWVGGEESGLQRTSTACQREHLLQRQDTLCCVILPGTVHASVDTGRDAACCKHKQTNAHDKSRPPV